MLRKLNRTNPYYPGPIVTTYPIHSSVLGGAVITVLNETGGKGGGYVYAGGTMLAVEAGYAVTWQHRNPVTGSLRQTRADTSQAGREELDPEGVDVGTSDPALAEDAGGGSAREREGRAKAVLGGGADGACFMDFMAVDCAQVYRLLDTGVAVQCPNNDCGPQSVRDENGTPVGWRIFMGSGYWFGNGQDSDYGFFDDLVYLDPNNWNTWALSLKGRAAQPNKQRRQVRPTLPIPVPEQPPVTNPQNPVIVPHQDFGEGIQNLLDNPDCAKFVNDLINAAAAKLSDPLEAKTIMDIFNKLNSSGKVIFEPQGHRDASGRFSSGEATGSFAAGNATIYISGYPAWGAVNDKVSGAANLFYSQTALGETIHQAGRNGLFSDRALAEVSSRMTGIPGLPTNPRDGDANSDYFHNKVLATLCK